MQQITGTPSAHCVVLASTYGYQGILEHAITAWRINILLHGVRMQQMYARHVQQTRPRQLEAMTKQTANARLGGQSRQDRACNVVLANTRM